MSNPTLPEILPCPTCKTNEHVKMDAPYMGFSLCCDNCYDCDCVGDPPEYVSLAPLAWGMTQQEAIESWNELVANE